ncbi:DNA recombination and repair protein RecF [Halorhodospira halochloris]|uniref:DNA recombination and repair protein RecF n=2 Tax=Halorhodospira halochloris TaxID=1052 RepID=A0A0X8X703_HALHR|nr:DNA recombination and repair protein RecF [Halorhodospira halochloris]
MTLTKTPVAEILSRGQQKLLVVALLLAEVKLWADQGLQPLLLIDDLAAELDIHHLAYVMQSIANIEAQVFLTAIDSKPLAVINQDADWYALSSGCLEPMRHF